MQSGSLPATPVWALEGSVGVTQGLSKGATEAHGDALKRHAAPVSNVRQLSKLSVETYYAFMLLRLQLL